MDKFSEYLKIILETLRWKKPEPHELPLYFLNDIDKLAQQYGYMADGYGENENKRVIIFKKIE